MADKELTAEEKFLAGWNFFHKGSFVEFFHYTPSEKQDKPGAGSIRTNYPDNYFCNVEQVKNGYASVFMYFLGKLVRKKIDLTNELIFTTTRKN